MEAKLHRDIFVLFFCVWSNPDSKIYQIVKYLLDNSPENSRTWSLHLRHLCQKYELTDPLEWLRLDPPSKSTFKENILTKISAHHERGLRSLAKNNSKT